MLQYRHRKFGHIVDVPEPQDVLAQADIEAERVARIGTKRAKRDAEAIGEYAQWQANRQRQTLARMDESRKWERWTPPPVAQRQPDPEPEAPAAVETAEPKPAKRAPAKATSTAPAESDD